jgi:hypothetical protein
MTIKRKDPVREAFSSCSTGNIPGPYYETKGHAVNAFNAALKEYGFHFDFDDLVVIHGDKGHAIINVQVKSGEVAGQAVFS